MIDHFLPRPHLDACLAAVYSCAADLVAPTSRSGLELALRKSLATFIRSELGHLLNIHKDADYLPMSLHQFVIFDTDLSAKHLLPHICRRATQWRDGVVELLRRLERDWSCIVKHFNLDPTLSLDAVGPPLADLHHNGRSVYKVTFSNGSAIIYKPRSIEAELAFSETLAWLNENGCEPALRACPALPREDYGWMAYVQTTHCLTPDQITAYYARQGQYAALFWLLAGSDAVADNVVVALDQPVWVDTECMCTPDLGNMFSGQRSVPDWITESTLATAMVIDSTDASRVLRRQTGLSVSCTKNRADVFGSDDILHPRYGRAVIRGFREMYRWLLDREAVRAIDRHPLLFWRNRRVRVILRSTDLYTRLSMLLVAATTSRYNSILRTIEDFFRTGDRSHKSPFPEAVIQAEIAALERSDIPYWYTFTTSRDLYESGGGRAEAVVTLTGMERVVQRAKRMNGEDLDRQAWLLSSFVNTFDAHRSQARTEFDATRPPV